MFSLFFHGIQADFLIFCIPPVVCACFRYLFIFRFGPKKSPVGEWRKWWECFRYGFWWGMDFNAYVFLVLMLAVSLPSAFLPAYFEISDSVRVSLLCTYLTVLYLAFFGKWIFYFHFHDVFNPTIKLGLHADKKNFADIFFHQNHGGRILLGYIPYMVVWTAVAKELLYLPRLPYAALSSPFLQYGLNALVFLGAILLFYWFRYGGTLHHSRKPEWDEVPKIVKDDIFLAKATMDDLIALEFAWKHSVSDALMHTDEEAEKILQPVLKAGIVKGENPLLQFRRTAGGARIKKPSHVFFLLGESHAQAPFDELYRKLHLMEGSEKLRKDGHSVFLQNFLPAGMISQPALVSLLTGIYDADMELNENKDFWYGNVPTSLPLQMKRLGYRAEFWYGGGLNWGSLEHFVPAIGFDACYGGTEICPKDAPRTWLGIYDHVFLEEAARRIEAEDVPSFHFLYTTSNHGPYHMPYEEYGFSIEKLMPELPQAKGWDEKTRRKMAGIWYADQCLVKFIARMKVRFPDSLFVVTGDHSMGAIPFEYDVVPRSEPNLREEVLTSFAMYHRELTQDMLAGNAIGCHMNILPTLMELIAPKDFAYYSILPSLTDKIEYAVTPYCWITEDRLGDYRHGTSQELAISGKLLDTVGETRFAEEREAWCELTGWMVRHPELLDDAGRGEKV